MRVEVVKAQSRPFPEWHVVVYDAKGREVARYEEFWSEASAERIAAQRRRRLACS